MPSSDLVKPSLVRKYFFEYVVIALVVAVVTLFKMYINMNNFIQGELKEMVIKTTVTIEQNNNLLKTQK
jgi:hypothetical protein